ncbi:hypothetical protein ZIOFF_021596 [Zingiber officinale]|uniref:Uncharacterized protein n=1 Tax=Zingiber officinale TaxID=94328 RepID=A0A8J5LJN9_ZINOF|nr:hypothetical protein ZIOFF_021596 [Zingiber officinale]
MAFLLPLTDTPSNPPVKRQYFGRTIAGTCGPRKRTPASCSARGPVKDVVRERVIRVCDPLRSGGLVLSPIPSLTLLGSVSPSSLPSPSLKPEQQTDEEEEGEKQRYYVNMGYAIRSLREDFTDIFQREPNFEIYRRAYCIFGLSPIESRLPYSLGAPLPIPIRMCLIAGMGLSYHLVETSRACREVETRLVVLEVAQANSPGWEESRAKVTSLKADLVKQSELLEHAAQLAEEEKKKNVSNLVTLEKLQRQLSISESKLKSESTQRDDIVFKDPLNSFVGIDNYKRIFWALRFTGSIFFRVISINIVSIWQPVENIIMIRWIVHGVPRVPWESHGRFDGNSEYKLDKNGKIYEHRVDNVALNTPTKFKVLPVEELIQLLGCPSTPKPTYFESPPPKGISCLPFLFRFSWIRCYFVLYLIIAYRRATKDCELSVR